MINTTQPVYNPNQNNNIESTYSDMNSLAKRFNNETRILTQGTGKKVLIIKRKAKSYTPILN